jgi:septum formation protein
VSLRTHSDTIFLASGSPRRIDYFRLLGLPFSSVSPDVDEIVCENAGPQAAAEELALRKVRKVVEATINHDDDRLWVCGADTLVAMNGKIFGKPKNRDDARNMLRLFSGNTHEVITAVALYSGRTQKSDCRSVVSTISFAPISDGEIDWYLDSGEWQDAAGSYKIQGLASCFVSKISGSYSSIVGLPLREFYVMLRDNGYPYGG